MVEDEYAHETVESMRAKGTTEIKLEIFFGYLSVKPKTHTQILKSLGNRDEWTLMTVPITENSGRTAISLPPNNVHPCPGRMRRAYRRIDLD
jgi:hypothetical protein